MPRAPDPCNVVSGLFHIPLLPVGTGLIGKRHCVIERAGKHDELGVKVSRIIGDVKRAVLFVKPDAGRAFTVNNCIEPGRQKASPSAAEHIGATLTEVNGSNANRGCSEIKHVLSLTPRFDPDAAMVRVADCPSSATRSDLRRYAPDTHPTALE
jgi:hypothetical protein